MSGSGERNLACRVGVKTEFVIPQLTLGEIEGVITRLQFVNAPNAADRDLGDDAEVSFMAITRGLVVGKDGKLLSTEACEQLADRFQKQLDAAVRTNKHAISSKTLSELRERKVSLT